MAVAFGSTASAGGSSTCSVPTGTANGHALVMHVQCFTQTDTPSCTGWAQMTNSPQSNSGSSKEAWFSRIAASEPSTYTLSGATSGTTNMSITRFTGADGTTPFNASNGQANASSSSAPTGSITPSVANCMLFGLWASGGNVFTKPASMTQANNIDGGDFMDAYELLAGGSGVAVSRTATLSGPIENVGALVAIAPPTAAGGIAVVTAGMDMASQAAVGTCIG